MTKKVYKEGGGVFEGTEVDITMHNMSFLQRKNTVTYSAYCNSTSNAGWKARIRTNLKFLV